ncbi:MAG: DUF4442 domain-containing protein, partial [Polaromonas sp.]|nr:DUF4442 domain-containing protein [Polaromonas sp.]
MSDHKPNRLERQLAQLKDVPAFARPWFRSVVLRRARPLTRPAPRHIQQMKPPLVEKRVEKENPVQKHNGGV